MPTDFHSTTACDAFNWVLGLALWPRLIKKLALAGVLSDGPQTRPLCRLVDEEADGPLAVVAVGR
jgi:hypothetical protein